MQVYPKLVLASSSPFRKEVLQKVFPSFLTASPNIDESAKAGETPIALSKRLAYEKVCALSEQFPQHLIIGSDQVAMLNDQQLTKPGSHENCIKQLSLSSGNIINFYTSLCVFDSANQAFEVATDTCSVHMKKLSIQEIEHYVAKDKPYGCAAAFKSEGLGIALFNKIVGEDPNALVGLPLIKLIQILDKFGVKAL